MGTDTFMSGDSKFRYEQVYVDLESKFGAVFPLRSRNCFANSLVDFCCKYWVPLFLLRDNIEENTGGALIDECRKRDIKSVFICPRHPQQNHAEGYIGRVTAMASFAMVYAGAPLWMWIYTILAAVFINNITAAYYSKKALWATPFELVSGEPFPDSSIVVPFGCGVLVLRDSDDRPKFEPRCFLGIFLHYADDHPLFTYAIFNPRTKRVLFRQDCIFLTSLFPMRTARETSGLAANGERLTVFRSPSSIRDNCEMDLSFGDWGSTDPLPDFENAMEIVFDRSPPTGTLVHPPAANGDLPSRFPDHPDFPPSGVSIPIIAAPMGPVSHSLGPDSKDTAEVVQLHHREPWMIEGDPRTDAEADAADWRKASNDLFPPLRPLTIRVLLLLRDGKTNLLDDQ